MRKPVAKGSFYPSNKEEIKNFISKYIIRENKKKENVKIAIVPHAGYSFSGKLAAKVIGKINKKENFIIIGVNHSSLGNKISISKEDFETPLGIVRNNLELSRLLLKKFKEIKIDSDFNEIPHNYEHSIEVILPFLQESQKNFKIISLLVKDLSYEECIKIAEIISKLIDDKTCLLVSSDFTHYGLVYDFVPFYNNIKENLYNLDKKVINEILNLNSKKVYEYAIKTTICGLYGITIATECAKIKNLRSELIDYYTSGDVTKDYNIAVGYAGIIFY
ncbi:MAG: AmmeMemoRadiSam system protein B [Candidatus Pacearchaeota archaeon]